MGIKVIVYLKSGGELVSNHYGGEADYVSERFVEMFADEESKAVRINNGNNTHVIPRDNVAAISILEVAE